MKVTSLRYLDAKFHHPSPKIKKMPKNTNGRLAIPALAGLLVVKLLWPLVQFICVPFAGIDIVGPLLLNASLLVVLLTDYSDWLVQVTQLNKRTNFTAPVCTSYNASVILWSSVFTPPPGQTGRRRHDSFNLSARSFVRPFPSLWSRYFNMWTNSGANLYEWSTGQGHETMNFWVRRSKVKVTGGRR